MPHVEWNPFKKVGNVRCTAAKCKRFCSDTAGNFNDKKNHIISSIAIKFNMIRALRIILHVKNKFNTHTVSSSFNEKSWRSSNARKPCFLNTTKPKKNFGSCSTYGFCDIYYSHIYPNRLDDWYNGSNRISIWYLTKRDVIAKEWSYIICLKIYDNDKYDFFVSLQIVQ